MSFNGKKWCPHVKLYPDMQQEEDRDKLPDYALELKNARLQMISD